MYKIIGTDQKEYGPISADQIRQWIGEGRINAQTKVQAGEGADWKLLADIPEFAEALKNRVSPLPIRPSATPAKTSGLAIASLVLGILGALTCGVTALVGLVLGIISMVKIKKNGGQLGGSGIALSGTIVSAVFIVLIPVFAILAAMLLPALAKAKQRAQTIACVNNMKQLALGVRIYSSDNKDQFPPAANWCDAIRANVGSEKPFKCPSGDANQKCHYAFNAKLAGLEASKVAPDTVLIFETGGGWNLSGGPELMLDHSRHGRVFVVALADGSVQQINESRLNTLRWDP
jgi:type II secretory pathway pseudopilin PulG